MLKNAPKKIISIYASKVAACIGMNKFVGVEDALLDYWKSNGYESKIFDKTPKIKLDPNHLVADEKTIKQILKKNPELSEKHVQEIKVEIKKNKTKQTDKVVSAIKQTTLDSKLIQKIKKENPILNIDTKEIKAKVYKNNGIKHETKNIDDFSKKESIKIHERNNKLYSKKITEHVKVYGRIDGLSEKGDIIETKNRQRRLFGFVPLYEKVQCYIYMFLLDKDKCLHIENYKDKYNKEVINFDQLFFEEIKYDIEEFYTLYMKLLTNKDMQQALITENRILDVGDSDSEIDFDTTSDTLSDSDSDS
jgi:hypothetical protein